MKEWPKIIRQLQAEQRVSQRELSRRSGLNRTTLGDALSGQGRLSLGCLETILTVFGYHLTAVSRDGEKLECRPSLRVSVAGKSSPPGNAAHAKPSGTKNAKPASINSGHPHANAATTANGNKPAKPSSPSTGAA